jgi:hypothetical protein
MPNRSKIASALMLGACSFVLLFLLGEGQDVTPLAQHLHLAALLVGMALFFLIAQYRLSRGNPDAARTDWPIIAALNAVLALTVVMAIVVERDKATTLQMCGMLGLAVLCSFAGAVLAGRAARR